MTGKKYILSPEQIEKITRAVMSAEKGTTGEIVPMIVSRSSAIGHLPFYVGLLLFSLTTVSFIEVKPVWITWGFGLPIAFVFLICLFAGYLLSKVSLVQRLLIPESDEERQVWNRAFAEWALSQAKKTKDRTGILLFVSIMERKAVVLADEGIAKHYPPETWQTVIDLLTRHLHKGDWVEGFENAIRRCGEILKTHLPAGKDNVNEVSDRVIIKD